MALPLIAFVCVNYRNSAFTLDFCESLIGQRGLGSFFEMICVVVDNSFESEDSSRLCQSLLKFDWVKYVAPERNLGYFGGLNFGLDNLSLNEANCVVLCNNDLQFDESFCQVLCSRKYASDIYAICPDVVTPDGFHQNPHIKKRISWWRRKQFDLYYFHYFVACMLMAFLKIVRPAKRNSVAPLVEQEIHMGIGACYVLTREFLNVFKRLEYPKFLYGEEAYFSNQIHLAGGILWFDPALLVHHAESATLSKIPKRKAYEFAREGYSGYRGML